MSSCKKIEFDNGLRSLIVATTLAAVLLLGFSYIIVGFSIEKSDSKPTAFCEIIFPGNGGSMTKTEPFNSGKSFFLNIPAIVNGQNPVNRPNTAVLKFSSVSKTDSGRVDYYSNATSVFSYKAMEFTLVGAKPSGTS